MRGMIVGIALIVGCSSGARTPEPAPPWPEASARSERLAARRAASVVVTSCSARACLEANEGEVIDIAGTFVSPPDRTRKGQHRYTLALADGTKVILPNPKDDATRATLSPASDGKRVTVRGRIYTRNIPDRYGIIASTADPYVVEMFTVLLSP